MGKALSHIIDAAKLSIDQKEYNVGKETKYTLFTIKTEVSHYLVMLMIDGNIITEKNTSEGLVVAKDIGMQMLMEYTDDATPENTSLYHYKMDRPNGNPWVKDSQVIMRGLFQQTAPNKIDTLNTKRLHEICRQFTRYRNESEALYLAQERNYKTELFEKLREIFTGINDNPEWVKQQLIQFVSLKQSESKHVRALDNLLSASYGYAQRDDFRVYLEHTSDSDFQQLFITLLTEGPSAELRNRISDDYKTLFEQGKMAPNKTKATPISLQFIAVLLMANHPDQYCLYKPTEYEAFSNAVGFNLEGDIVYKYKLFIDLAKYVLHFAQMHDYKLDDLIDVHNMIYLFGKEHQLFDFHQTDQEVDFLNAVSPQNLIYYGPPGTGKTYHTIYKCLELIDPSLDKDLLVNPTRREEAVDMFNKYVESNQIMTCTFHQSFGYEEFVEGIRYDDESQSYQVRDGVLKLISANASTTVSNRKQSYEFEPDAIQFFKMSLGNTLHGEDEIYEYCITNECIALGWGGDIDYTKCTSKPEIEKLFRANYPDETAFVISAVDRFKNWMQVDDIVIISHGNKKAKAIGRIEGEYYYDDTAEIGYKHFRKVKWLYVSEDYPFPVERILKKKVFSQQTIYTLYADDMNIESIRELISSNESSIPSQYVLLIDEINRGNISKIFGELITLIEPDKRKGNVNQMSVTLPYSQESFHLPANVHIIGTMNTADRSIALLDTALRRRFDFIEMMPDYDVLPTNIEGVNIQKLLNTINDRVEYLYDRDHLIGHAYFLTTTPSLDFYIQVMKLKVIPLLQEYFYDNWEQIELVLGGSAKGNNTNYFLNQQSISPDRLFPRSTRWTELEKIRYVVQANPAKQALMNVYQSVSTTGDEEE